MRYLDTAFFVAAGKTTPQQKLCRLFMLSVLGRISHDAVADPEVDDLLDDVAELVLQKGGQVMVIPAEKMPTDTGLAATYRF